MAVIVPVGKDMAPGAVYHGTINAAGVDAVRIAVRLDVEAPPKPGGEDARREDAGREEARREEARREEDAAAKKTRREEDARREEDSREEDAREAARGLGDVTGAPGGMPDADASPPRPARAAGPGAGSAWTGRCSRALLLALVEEGRRFAATPDGDRWRHVLAGASAAREGRALWTAAGLDQFLTGADRGPGSPRAMAEDILALLAAEEPPRDARPLRFAVAARG